MTGERQALSSGEEAARGRSLGGERSLGGGLSPAENGEKRVLLVMLISAALAATSNLWLRHAMAELGGGTGWTSMATSPDVLVGLFGYGVSQLLWLNVLARARLGAIFPVFIGTTFVLVLGGSVVALGEPLTAWRLAGAALVAGGIIVAEWSGGSMSPGGSAASDGGDG